MNIVETLMSSAGTGVVDQLAKQFGVTGDQAGSVLSAVVPMLAGTLQDKVSGGEGAGLMSMITSGALGKFAANPGLLNSPEAATQGQSMLSQIFGGQKAVDGIAAKAAETSGVGPSLMQSMLPILTTLFMSFLSQKAGNDPAAVTSMLGTLAGGGEGGLLGAVKGLASKVFG